MRTQLPSIWIRFHASSIVSLLPCWQDGREGSFLGVSSARLALPSLCNARRIADLEMLHTL